MEELLPFQFIMTVRENDGDSWHHIAVFSKDVVESEYGPIGEMTQDEKENLASNLTGWGEFYRGVGCAFGAVPSIRFKGSKVEVRQYCGLDV